MQKGDAKRIYFVTIEPGKEQRRSVYEVHIGGNTMMLRHKAVKRGDGANPLSCEEPIETVVLEGIRIAFHGRQMVIRELLVAAFPSFSDAFKCFSMPQVVVFDSRWQGRTEEALRVFHLGNRHVLSGYGW